MGDKGTGAPTPPKARRTTEEVVNEILKKVLRCSVQPPAEEEGAGAGRGAAEQGKGTVAGVSAGSVGGIGGGKVASKREGVVFLEQLAAELLSESAPLLLSPANAERAIMARLENPPGLGLGASRGDPAAGGGGVPREHGSPSEFCLGAYGRAVEEGRKVAGMKDKERQGRVQEALEAVKDLLLSYYVLATQHQDMFPSYGAIPAPSPLLPRPSPSLAPPGSSSPLTDLIAGPYTPPLSPHMQGPLAPFFASLGPTPGHPPASAAPIPASPALPVVSSPGTGLPSGFLDQLLGRCAEDDESGLHAVIHPVFADLAHRVRFLSLLGPFQLPLHSLLWLASFPPLAKALVEHPSWVPAQLTNSQSAYRQNAGRILEMQSVLGPFLHISVLPDPIMGNGEPNVRQQLFSKPSERRAAEISSSYVALRTTARQLWEGLHELLRGLLKAPPLREGVLHFLATCVNCNVTRSQLQVDLRKVSSHGFFFNLSAIMLKLCEPFLNSTASAASKLDKLDPSYVLQAAAHARLAFNDLTAVHATSDEIASWVDQRNYARQESYRQAQQQREAEELERIRKEQGQAAGAGTAANPFAPMPLLPPSLPLHAGGRAADGGAGPEASSSSSSRSREAVEGGAGAAEEHRNGQGGAAAAGAAGGQKKQYSFVCECFFITARVLHLGLLKVNSDYSHFSQRAGQQDQEALNVLEGMRGPGEPPDLEQQIAAHRAKVDSVKEVLHCYEVAVRDPELVQQAVRFYQLMILWLASLVGGFKLPLPAPCPMEFAAMPEHFVDNCMDVLLLASSMHHALDGIPLDDFMTFIVMFMGSPLHIKNPYLRAKMVEVLQHWMPSHCPTSTLASKMASLFEGHPMAMQQLTPNLLKLYVDIEFTGSHTAFYDKFQIRSRIADLLQYLWEVPSHRAAWVQMSVVEQRGFYLRFLSLLINDSIYLLDDALEKIPKLKQEEAEQADRAQWVQLPAEERQTREEELQREQRHVKYDMQLADANVKMIQYSTTEIVLPFLLPEMVERVAAMLNYFLLQLVGAKRKALRLSDPEKYGFHPKKLLTQIVSIYIHLDRGDSKGAFAEAISADGRSYREEALNEAASVLRTHGLMEEGGVREFEQLGRRVKKAAKEAEAMEEDMEDVPSEFLDPVQFTLMKDPVQLPSNNVMDRSVILRHLLSDPKDPFTRAHLTPEMLTPLPELKAKIAAFLQARRQRGSETSSVVMGANGSAAEPMHKG